MGAKENLVELSGTVSAIVYQNEENGYTVLRLETGDGGQVTVVGCLPFAALGEQLIISGNWTRHPSHGEQFQVVWADRVIPSGKEAIYTYLASRVVKGVGPATAAILVEAFGDDTLEVLEHHPEKLAQLRGISTKKAMEISEQYRRQMGLRRLMEFLNHYELRPQLAMRLYQFYGDAALDVLKENPYLLAADHIGADFNEADNLAIHLGFEDDSPQRIAAAVIFELVYNSSNGHCFIPRHKLIAATSQLIGVSEEAVSEGVDVLIETGEVVCEPVANTEGCYLQRLHTAEEETARYLAERSAEILHTELDIETLIDRIERENDITYAPMQRECLRVAARRKLMVITGGPGTGKTTTVRGILALFDVLGLETQLAAPTGRAAQRMSELTGREAVTVHRLLECGFSGDERELVFRKNHKERLSCDAIILDESSMIDIPLMYALLDAMGEDCRLVMVGDADQLPAVGPGNVFSDIIRSKIVETVQITEIFRQTAQSRIVENAHLINQGIHPDFRNGGDFFFLRRRESDDIVKTVVELCATRLPNNMGIPPEEIQVLTPTRRYTSGTQKLNMRLQAALNPPSPEKAERRFGDKIFRVGDRVMQVRNNYDILWSKDDESAGMGIFNGDIGKIVAINQEEELLAVDFDGKLAVYSVEMLGELEHAFAMTIHKSQGSEFRVVILCAGRGAPMLMHRGVLYTGVTRARELLVVVGDDRIVDHMIDNYRQTRRYSGLRSRLTALQNKLI
ncbi:MAG: ATP-dependent RecD-like DNA helicase [Oscillospiraceae bacterium]|jgi:exodeoxyribonuclease V alpha subunit